MLRAPNRSRPALWTIATCATAALALTATAASAAPLTDRVSITTGGFAVSGGDGGLSTNTERRSLSHDGRFAVFAASAPLVKGQGNLDWQILVRDRMRGTTRLASVAGSGAKANGRSWNPSISADGRYVVFESSATNLVAGDTNGDRDIFVHDRATGSTSRVSVTSTGAQADSSHGSTAPSISADGRYVAFVSDAALTPGLGVSATRAFLHDRTAGTTELISVGADGLPRTVTVGTGVSVSGNGARVLFTSGDSDVTPDAHNLDPDVFLRDRTSGTTVRVAGNEDGALYASISANGAWVAYESRDDDIVATDTNGQKDIFLTQVGTGTHQLVSRTASGSSGNHASLRPAISADGRYVSFESLASNLVSGDTNAVSDVFRFDAATGVVTRVSVKGGGAQATRTSYMGGISGDGQHVTFQGYDLTLSGEKACCWNFTYVHDVAGRWPALRARVTKIPARTRAKRNTVIQVRGIAAGERVKTVWIPLRGTKGKKVVRHASVRSNRITVKAGPKVGSYRVKVFYADHLLKTQKVRTRR